MEKGGRAKRVLVDFLLKSQSFRKGYTHFRRLFLKPLGWIYAREEKDPLLRSLDAKAACDYVCHSAENEAACVTYLATYFDTACRGPVDRFPRLVDCHAGKPCAFFVLAHENHVRGFLALDALKPEAVRRFKDLGDIFQDFLTSEVALAYRNYEIKNFYETVHPRALALSTLHSVHRVISASLRLKDLLPRIARLSSQVLGAKYASIFLLDDTHTYLVPHFVLGEEHRVHKRLAVGRGLEGRVAQSGDAVLQQRLMCVPLIGDEIMGVLTLRRSAVDVPFRTMDLEILRTIAEQAVIAIRNSKLYEEGEAITLGSIKAINDILELGYKGDAAHLPLFAELVTSVGRELHLSSEELQHLNRAIFLLDTGHVGISPEILQKSAPLTKKEVHRIRQHPVRGASLLASIQSLKPVIPIILHHHERFDGKGYPQGLMGSAIPVGARIVSVVDAFMAMTSERPYRKRKTLAEALEEIKTQAGTQFDPDVVRSFLHVVSRMDWSAAGSPRDWGRQADFKKGA